MADYLPREVLFDTFARLPVKTILVCTSVCKSWHSLIKNPNFINFHLNRPRTLTYNNTHDLLLVRSCSKEESKKEPKEVYSLHCDDEAFDEYAKLPFPFKPAYNCFYRIVGSCNGVVCLSDDQISYVDNTILWNPTIRKWVRLPKPRVTFGSHGSFHQVLDFGYDAKSNDYKVVRIVYLLDSNAMIPPEVDVYTLSTGTWRNISHLRIPYLIGGGAEKSPQVYLNGAVHWVGQVPESSCLMVVSFHMGDEAFGNIEPPAVLANNRPWLISPAVVQGSLSLIKGSAYHQSWCIWVMKQYGVASSWTKLVDISIGDGIDRVLGFRKKGELLVVATGDLLSFNPEVAQVKKLGISSCTGDWYKDSFHTVSYAESLVLLGSWVHVEENGDESNGDESEEELAIEEEADNRVVAGLPDQSEEPRNG